MQAAPEITRDLDYFTESRMSLGTFNAFYNKLPRHIQTKFEGLHVASVTDVLQGYRGPSHFRDGSSGDSESLEPIDGVQEIRFWFAISKHFNWFPLYGSIVFGAARGLQGTFGSSTWRTFFFEEVSGRIMSSDEVEPIRKVNQKATNHFDLGLLLEEQGKLMEAYDEHQNAYELTYSYKVKFLTHKTSVEVKLADALYKEGLSLMKSCDFETAINKFEAAEIRTNDEVKKELFRSKVVEAKELQSKKKEESSA